MIRMSIKNAEWIQFWLAEYLPIDNPSAVSMVGGEFDRKHWQFVVDMIYRLLVCDLIKLLPENILVKHDDLSFDGVLGYCNALALQNPYSFERTSEPPVPWIGPSIGITRTTLNLLEKHGMVWKKRATPLPINESFIEDIEDLFEMHGVMLSDVALIPISIAAPTNQTGQHRM